MTVTTSSTQPIRKTTSTNSNSSSSSRTSSSQSRYKSQATQNNKMFMDEHNAMMSMINKLNQVSDPGYTMLNHLSGNDNVTNPIFSQDNNPAQSTSSCDDTSGGCNDGCCDNNGYTSSDSQFSSAYNNFSPFEVNGRGEGYNQQQNSKDQNYVYYNYNTQYSSAYYENKPFEVNDKTRKEEQEVNGKGQGYNDEVSCLDGSCNGGDSCNKNTNKFTYYGYNTPFRSVHNNYSPFEVNGRGQEYSNTSSNIFRAGRGYNSQFSTGYRNYSPFEASNRGYGYNNEVSGYGYYGNEVGLNEQDGKIDNFRQGNIGDCWFLSGIDAVSRDKDGAAIIKQSIKKSANGGWDVNFKGAPGETFHVSESEMQQYASWSKGDPDVRILEIAGNKWRLKHKGRNLDAGLPQDAMHLLTGRKNTPAESRTAKLELLKQAAKDKDGLTMSACVFNRDPYGVLVAGHAYSVSRVDEATQTVELRNPWDNSKPIKMSWDQFLNSVQKTTLEEETNDGDNNIDDGDDKNDDKLDDLDLDKKFMLGLLNNMMQMFSQMMKMMMSMFDGAKTDLNDQEDQFNNFKPIDLLS